MTTNLLFGQVFIDRDLDLKGSVKSVNQIEFKTIEKKGKIEKGDTIECSLLKYEFDSRDRLLKEEYCLMDFLTSFTYKYDRNGRLCERMNYGKLETKYEYDDKGNLVKELMFNSEGLFGYWTYKYDNNKNRIERTGYLEESFVERWIKIYDQRNRKTNEYMVGEEPATIPTYTMITYEYDNKDRLIKTITTDPDTKDVQIINTYQYNEKGDLIEHLRKEGKSEIEVIYAYDKMGNWIQRIEFYNEKPTKITERRIEYK